MISFAESLTADAQKIPLSDLFIKLGKYAHENGYLEDFKMDNILPKCKDISTALELGYLQVTEEAEKFRYDRMLMKRNDLEQYRDALTVINDAFKDNSLDKV